MSKRCISEWEYLTLKYALGIVAVDVVRLVVGCLRVLAAGKIQESDVTELDGLALRLETNVSFAQDLSVDLNLGIEIVRNAAADLGVSYCSTVSPSIRWRTRSDPSTSTSTLTQSLPR